jgi:hypothetical protein
MRRAAAAAILVPSTCTIDEAWIVPSAAPRAASASAAGAGGGAPDRLGAATPDGHSSVVSAASSTEAATTSALRLLLCIGPPLYGSADGSPAGATGEEPPLPAGVLPAAPGISSKRSASGRVRVAALNLRSRARIPAEDRLSAGRRLGPGCPGRRRCSSAGRSPDPALRCRTALAPWSRWAAWPSRPWAGGPRRRPGPVPGHRPPRPGPRRRSRPASRPPLIPRTEALARRVPSTPPASP